MEEAYKVISETKPELVFLDINMPTGNGFKLLQKYERPSFEVIFVTSYDKYAINAIKFSALDYLLKPVDINDLQRAVDKAADVLARKHRSDERISGLLSIVVDDMQAEPKIAVHANDKVQLLQLSDIVCLEADRRYSVVHTITRARFTVSRSLREFEELFAGKQAFIRINKNTIVNAQHLKNYSKGSPCLLQMANDQTFEISRRKKQEVLDRINFMK